MALIVKDKSALSEEQKPALTEVLGEEAKAQEVCRAGGLVGGWGKAAGLGAAHTAVVVDVSISRCHCHMLCMLQLSGRHEALGGLQGCVGLGCQGS